jgi:DNA-binding LytR/AlgR family response regulator
MKKQPQLKCLIVDDDELSRSIIQDLINEVTFLELVAICENPMEAFNILRKEEVDVMFLDIEMPRITGMEMLHNLKKGGPEVILMSSHDKYAVESYNYKVIDYLVKPVNVDKFLKAITKAKLIYDKKLEANGMGKSIFIKSDSKLFQLETDEILWVEAFGNYVTFKTKESKFTVNITMKEVEKRLPASEFVRVHRSTIVRRDKINEIHEDHVFVVNKPIPIGGVYRDALISSLNFL